MFDNIGKKLMDVAKILCWLGIIASLILGIALIAIGTADTSRYNDQATSSVITGIIIIVVGCITSWISSIALYGFGQLIEDNKAMRRLMEENVAKQQSASLAGTPRKTVVTGQKKFWTCDKCGKINPNTVKTCRNCGEAK